MPSPGTRTIGRGQSLSRLARHGRGVVVHGGKLIVPTISDVDTIRPEIVAPLVADRRELAAVDAWRFCKGDGQMSVVRARCTDEPVASITNSTQVSVPFSEKPPQTPFGSNDSCGAYVYPPATRCDCPSGLVTVRSTVPAACAGVSGGTS